MQIKHEKDFWSGIFFILIGLLAVIFAQENSMGTLSRMGPAYFPTILGVGLVLLGLVISVRALVVKPKPGESYRLEPVHWGVLLFVLGGVACFALALLSLGLIIALALMIAVASLASPLSRRREVGILIIVLCAVCWGVFVYGLGFQVPVLPTFL